MAVVYRWRDRAAAFDAEQFRVEEEAYQAELVHAAKLRARRELLRQQHFGQIAEKLRQKIEDLLAIPQVKTVTTVSPDGEQVISLAPCNIGIVMPTMLLLREYRAMALGAVIDDGTTAGGPRERSSAMAFAMSASDNLVSTWSAAYRIRIKLGVGKRSNGSTRGK